MTGVLRSPIAEDSAITKEQLEPGAKKPTAEVKSLLEAAKLLGAA